MLFYIIFTICLFHFTISSNYTVFINTSSPIRHLSDPDRFLSVTLDSITLHSFKNMNELPFNNALNFSFIVPLAKALGPAYLRFGGTEADYILFQETFNQATAGNYTICTGADLNQLYNFTKTVGWTLVYDLNQLLRNGSNWNSTNAQQLINYASQNNYAMNFELGNEPDLYHDSSLNITLTGEQIADGYKALRKILNETSLYKNSLLIGPSIALPVTGLDSYRRQLFTDFLNNGGGTAITALTFHHYYMNGKLATLEDFLNITILNNFQTVLNGMNSLGYTPLWLSETSSAYGGGAPHLSDTYAAGFLWLDKLGLGAKNGLDMIIRQDIWGGNYALLNYSMYPNPDYWLSVVYKKLVGAQIFNVTTNPIDENLRLYAASSAKYFLWICYGCHNNFLNVTNPAFGLFETYGCSESESEGEPGNLKSKSSTLNGNLLQFISHQPGPVMRGTYTNLPVTLPEYSQFFIVSNENTSLQCPTGWYKENTYINKCILLVNETKPVFAAEFDCSIYGANSTLLSIDSAFENLEILGQTKNNQCNKFVISLARSSNNWTWLNGDSNSYRNWNIGYPTSENTQNCVTFDSQTGTWTNSDCDLPQCYICQQYFQENNDFF